MKKNFKFFFIDKFKTTIYLKYRYMLYINMHYFNTKFISRKKFTDSLNRILLDRVDHRSYEHLFWRVSNSLEKSNTVK